jgi:hypothetical protein
MAYDTKCYDLAACFLEDEPSLNTVTNRNTLAQTIQDAIESEIKFLRGDYAPSPPDPEDDYADRAEWQARR